MADKRDDEKLRRLSSQYRVSTETVALFAALDAQGLSPTGRRVVDAWVNHFAFGTPLLADPTPPFEASYADIERRIEALFSSETKRGRPVREILEGMTSAQSFTSGQRTGKSRTNGEVFNWVYGDGGQIRKAEYEAAHDAMAKTLNYVYPVTMFGRQLSGKTIVLDSLGTKTAETMTLAVPGGLGEAEINESFGRVRFNGYAKPDVAELRAYLKAVRAARRLPI